MLAAAQDGAQGARRAACLPITLPMSWGATRTCRMVASLSSISSTETRRVGRPTLHDLQDELPHPLGRLAVCCGSSSFITTLLGVCRAGLIPLISSISLRSSEEEPLLPYRPCRVLEEMPDGNTQTAWLKRHAKSLRRMRKQMRRLSSETSFGTGNWLLDN